MSRRVQVISASPKSNLCPGTQHPLRRIPGSIRPTNQNKVISRRKFMRRISILMFVVLFCLISTASPQEQTKHSQFIIFDVPQAGVGNYEGTLGFSINQAGEVSGWYIDTNSVYHGYLRSPKGDFTTYNVTGGGTGSQQGTQPVILSNLGSVAGWYIDLNSVYHGFLRTRDGKITTFDAPRCRSWCQPRHLFGQCLAIRRDRRIGDRLGLRFSRFSAHSRWLDHYLR